MFREFKRHYHKTKRARQDAAQSGRLGFTIKSNGEQTTFSTEMPEKELLTRYVVLMQRFLNEKDSLYYRNTWSVIKSQFPNAILPSDIEFIEEAIRKIEFGIISFKFNGKSFTAKKIFDLISRAGYFELDEESQKEFQEISQIPLAHHLFWNQFMDFTFNFHRVIVVLFDIVLKIEQSEEYLLLAESNEPSLTKCIYCLTESGSFKSEEHIIPESLAGDYAFLPRGFVCDSCNNGICSLLDNVLLQFEPIAFLNVQYGSYNKAGKLPKANFQNMTMERTGPNEIKMTAKDKTGGLKNKKILKDGQIKLNFQFTGKKLDWKLNARAIYKIALGFVAFDISHETALDPKYQAARNFISKGGNFDNNMLVSKTSKPHHQIRTHLNTQFGGTGFLIDVFGMLFMINLEEEPKMLDRMGITDAKNNGISDHYQFELVSLS